jgi:hypothetical protein
MERPPFANGDLLILGNAEMLKHGKPETCWLNLSIMGAKTRTGSFWPAAQ